MDNQQLSSEQEKAQRLSQKGVGCKCLTPEVVGNLNNLSQVDDIVWSL